MERRNWNFRNPSLGVFLFIALFVCGVTSELTSRPISFQNAVSGRQTIDGDGYDGAGYTVMPLLSEEHPATAIIIHGLGGTGEEWGFISLALSFFSLNYVKFIVPSAPEAPVTYLGATMPSWFDITRLTRNSADVVRGQLLDSVNRTHDIIRGEIESGVSEDRIFIIGFSQGGAVALTSFLRSPFTLGGCIGVATWLPLESEYPRQRSENIKDKDILMLHGTEDEAVRPALARQSRDKLTSIGQSVNLTFLEGEPHIIMNTQVIGAIENFIATRAQGTTQYLKTLVKDLTKTFADLTTRLDSMPRF